MVIEFLGQQASEKTYLSKKLFKYFSTKGYKVTSLDDLYGFKNKKQKRKILIKSYILNLPYIFNKRLISDFKKLLFLKSENISFLKYLNTVFGLLYVYSIIKKKSETYDLVLLSEGFINPIIYIYRTEDEIDTKLMRNSFLLIRKFVKTDYYFINVRAKTNDLIDRRMDRIKKSNIRHGSINKEEIQNNEKLLHKLRNQIIIKDNTLEDFDSSTNDGDINKIINSIEIILRNK